MTGYFDIAASGFTMRIYYAEDQGIVSITDVQMETELYYGAWYPGGTVSVNGTPVLEMSFQSLATHVFNFMGAPASFRSWQVLSGASLPVSSERITTGRAEISADITLFRDSDTDKPKLNGSTTIETSAGLAHISNGSTEGMYQAYIDNGASQDIYLPYVDNGTGWDIQT